MKSLLVSSVVLFSFLLSLCEGGLFRPPRRNHRPRTSSLSSCPIPKIKNGTFRLQRAGRMGYFYCASGFEIHGAISILCTSGRWKQDIPICIKAGCPQPPKRSNGLVMLDEKKQKSMLFCQDTFVAAGTTIAFCNGTSWDRNLGYCRSDVGHSKVCDFETISICGWTQDEEENDFHWVRKSGWNSFEKLEYGPKHDHTTGIPLEGHYMIAEATNSRTTQRSRILSPIHNQSDSVNACFRFFYHMYGHNVGRLRVIMKTIEDAMDEVVDNPQNILFEVENSQGNQWNEGFFEIEPTKANFQIVIEATGSRGLISDIAIDDVQLLKYGDCLKHSKPEIETESEGIFDTQTCVNRCLETESVRGNGSETLHKDGHLIEKCDCHPECIDMLTCCLDYVSMCLEGTSQSTDSDIALNSFDESSVGTEMNEVTTQAQTTIETKPTQTTVKTTTQKSTDTTIMSTSTIPSTSKSTSATTKIVKTTEKSTPKMVYTTVKGTTKSTVTTPIKVRGSTMSTTSTRTKPIVTKTPTIINVTSTTQSNITILPTNRTLTTIEPVAVTTKRTTLTTASLKKVPSSTQSTKNTSRTVTKPTSKTSELSSTPILTSTLKASQFVSQKDSRTSWMICILSMILVCILSVLMLTGWKYLGAQKWNKFNSHQIEYKSNNYHSDEHAESLVRSNSFIIEDSFNEKLIDNSTDVESQYDDSENQSKSKKTSTENAIVQNKTKKNSDRPTKKCDQYSEKRCLTIDDEQFDFSLQMHD